MMSNSNHTGSRDDPPGNKGNTNNTKKRQPVLRSRSGESLQRITPLHNSTNQNNNNASAGTTGHTNNNTASSNNASSNNNNNNSNAIISPNGSMSSIGVLTSIFTQQNSSKSLVALGNKNNNTATTSSNNHNHNRSSHTNNHKNRSARRLTSFNRDSKLKRDPLSLLWSMARPRNAAVLLVSLTLLVCTRSLFDGSLHGYIVDGDSLQSILALATTTTALEDTPTSAAGTTSRTTQLQNLHHHHQHHHATSTNDGSNNNDNINNNNNGQLEPNKESGPTITVAATSKFALFATPTAKSSGLSKDVNSDGETNGETNGGDGTATAAEINAAEVNAANNNGENVESEAAAEILDSAVITENVEDGEAAEEAVELQQQQQQQNLHQLADNQLEARDRPPSLTDEDYLGDYPPPKFAYAFLLGGIPSPAAPGPALGNSKSAPTDPDTSDAYLGLLYNVLVSITILKNSGSTADFVVLVHMASPLTEELAPHHAKWFHDLNVTIQYTPPSPSYVNEISTIVLEKFRILELIEYDRVLFMNPDIMPYCNLDYIMHLSYGPKAVLQPNFLVSMGDAPASGTFFMLQPAPGAFQRLIHQLAKRKKQYHRFVPTVGYGINMTALKHSWRALGRGMTTRSSSWGFEGGDSDQGLLFHYTKYVHGNVSIAIGKEVEHFRKRKRIGISRNGTLLGDHSCLPQGGTAEREYGYQWFLTETQRAAVSPPNVAPYRDFAKWEFNSVKPWHYPRAPPRVASLDMVKNARKYWFHMVRQVDETLGLGLNFADTELETDAVEIGRPEKYDEFERKNWNYVPVKWLKDINPVWARKMHSLQQWALRIENPTNLTFAYEPPVIKEEAMLPLSSDTDDTPARSSMENLRSTCQCPTTISTDPCTTAAQPLEDWLGRRVKYYLSKRRPLCPNAARTSMHVVLPIHDLSIEQLKASVCSVACQDYPELSLLIYDDGSADATAIDELFGSTIINKQGLSFTPPSESDPVALDNVAQKVTAAAMNRYKRKIGWNTNTSSGLSIHNVRSTEHSGAASATFWALRMAEQLAGANDVLIVVNGGDELVSHRALQKINEKYIDESAWATCGAHLNAGDQEDHTMVVNTEDIAYQPAMFPKFHTFKAYLLQHVGAGDFMNDEKAWQQTASGRGLVYLRLLELAGVDRIGYTPQPLYRLNVPQHYSDVAELEDSDVATLEDVTEELDTTRRIDLPVHAILVCSMRAITFLAKQLVWLQDQSITETRQLHVHLVNSNRTFDAQIKSMVDTFVQQQEENGASIPIQITRAEYETDFGQATKYQYVHELRQTQALDALVLLDHNQYWPPNFIEGLLHHQKPKGMVTFRGKIFSAAPRNPETGAANFWVADVTWPKTKAKKQPPVKTVAFASPSGALFDPNLWLFHHQLLRLVGDLKDYQNMDGLWVSYLLDALLGWEQRLIELPIPVLDSNAWYNRVIRAGTFPLIPEEHAAALTELGDQMKAELDKASEVTTETERRRLLESNVVGFHALPPNEKKSILFSRLQTTFHWNVFRQEKMPFRQLVRPDFSLPSTTSASPPRPGTADNQEKRAFVCVTGQFDRFELENKIDTIFKPLQKDGYVTDAALVLSGGAIFTNHDKGDAADQIVPFYFNFSDAVSALELNKIRVLSQNGTYPRIEDPIVNKRYLSSLHENQKYWRALKVQVDRVKNHARIFDSYRRCIAYADGAAREAGFHNSSEYYQVFIRIRDDAGLNMPIDRMGGSAGEVMTDMIPPPPNSVTVTECRSWWGMNDRMAIISPDIAHLYFSRPYDVLTKDLFFDETVVINPESLLLNVFTSSKIHVLGHPHLKRVNRVVKQADGEVTFFKKDKFMAQCPEPFIYLKRNYGHYGWAL